MKNLLIPFLKYSTLYFIWQEKNKLIYTKPFYFQSENRRPLYQAVSKVRHGIRLVDTGMHRESINICAFH